MGIRSIISTNEFKPVLRHNEFLKQVLPTGFTNSGCPIFMVDEDVPYGYVDIQVDGVSVNPTYDIMYAGGGLPLLSGELPIALPALPITTRSGDYALKLYNNGVWFVSGGAEGSFQLGVRATVRPPQLTTFTVGNITGTSCVLNWTLSADTPADTRLLIIAYPTYNYVTYNKPVDYKTYWEKASAVWGQGSQIRNPYLDSYADRRVIYDGLASMKTVKITGLTNANRYWFGAFPFRQQETNGAASGLFLNFALSRIFQNTDTKTVNAVTPRA